MSHDEETCHKLEVLAERITRERELREALEQRLDERDRRYEDRFVAQERSFHASLAAQDKATSSAFTASEKAIAKAETSQIEYNRNHNDLSRKMEAQYKEMVPRIQVDEKFKVLDEKIADLREGRSSIQGRGSITSILWAVGASILAAVLGALLISKLIPK